MLQVGGESRKRTYLEAQTESIIPLRVPEAGETTKNLPHVNCSITVVVK
jgi:hypothetical protein